MNSSRSRKKIVEKTTPAAVRFMAAALRPGQGRRLLVLEPSLLDLAVLRPPRSAALPVGSAGVGFFPDGSPICSFRAASR
jgi:hypothetical protein